MSFTPGRFTLGKPARYPLGGTQSPTEPFREEKDRTTNGPVDGLVRAVVGPLTGFCWKYHETRTELSGSLGKQRNARKRVLVKPERNGRTKFDAGMCTSVLLSGAADRTGLTNLWHARPKHMWEDFLGERNSLLPLLIFYFFRSTKACTLCTTCVHTHTYLSVYRLYINYRYYQTTRQ
jgi:hypothetical protein